MSSPSSLSNKGFYPVLESAMAATPWERCYAASAGDVERALGKEHTNFTDFLALLSPAAEPYLEAIAQKAHAHTLRTFGNTVQLFTPLYLANHCTNRCVYCGFNAKRAIARHMLSLEAVQAEAEAIAATGLRRILALTGDAPQKTGVAYLADCVAVLSRYFSSVGIEVPSMTVQEYARVVDAGVDSMTMFQETYTQDRYALLHPAGPKRDYFFRLDAPQRAIEGGIRAVNIGPLLGLDDWRRDMLATALHGDFLLHTYPHVEVSVSLPRMRPCGEKPQSPEEQAFQPLIVTDKNFVQALVALRCFLPQAGITLSTREPAWLRDKLIPLGITRVSAGVCTAVGGHATHKEDTENTPQFAISDPRTVPQMVKALAGLGYQAVYTDWLLTGQGAGALPQGICRALGNKALVAEGHAPA